MHISKLGNGKRIDKVEDVVKVGDKLRVEIADIDNRGKISLVLVKEDEAAADGPSRADAEADAEAEPAGRERRTIKRRPRVRPAAGGFGNVRGTRVLDAQRRCASSSAACCPAACG